MGYSIAWEAHGAYCLHVGNVNCQDLCAALESISTHADFDRFHYAIHDLSQALPARQRRGALEQVLALALGAQYTNPSLKTAVVARLPAFVAMGRRYQEMALPKQVEIFQSTEEARHWLAQPHSFHAMPPTHGFVA